MFRFVSNFPDYNRLQQKQWDSEWFTYTPYAPASSIFLPLSFFPHEHESRTASLCHRQTAVRRLINERLGDKQGTTGSALNDGWLREIFNNKLNAAYSKSKWICIWVYSLLVFDWDPSLHSDRWQCSYDETMSRFWRSQWLRCQNGIHSESREIFKLSPGNISSNLFSSSLSIGYALDMLNYNLHTKTNKEDFYQIIVKASNETSIVLKFTASQCYKRHFQTI